MIILFKKNIMKCHKCESTVWNVNLPCCNKLICLSCLIKLQHSTCEICNTEKVFRSLPVPIFNITKIKVIE